MSTTLSTNLTVQQRNLEATRRLQELLDAPDTKLLATALAEAAIDQLNKSDEFRERIQAIYAELQLAKSPRTSRARKSSAPQDDLIPLIQVEERIDPFGPVDPYFLHRVYGASQLRRALSDYQIVRLKEAVRAVEDNTGVKATGKRTKTQIIDYIVEHVAGPGY